MSFSFGGFAAKTTASPQTTASSLFSFGNKPASSTSAVSSFFSTSSATTTQKPFSFAANASPATSSLFGAPSTTPQVRAQFGVVQQPQVAPPTESEIIIKSITIPQLFNDQRDTAMTKWNQLQLLYGDGTVYAGPNFQAKVNEANEYASFKSFTYGSKPPVSENQSIVVLLLKRPAEEVHGIRQSIIDFFHRMFENSPNVIIKIEGIKPSPMESTELRMQIIEKQPISSLPIGPFVASERQIPAVDVIRYIETVFHKSAGSTTGVGFGFASTSSATNWKVECEKMGFVDIFPEQSMSSGDLQLYLNNPPDGISYDLWKQANLENPDPLSLIPIPLIGFRAVQLRLKAQVTEAQIQREQIRKMEEQVSSCQKNLVVLRNRQNELHRCAHSCNHRLLESLLAMHNKYRHGTALSTNEESLQSRVTELINRAISNGCNAPKSRLQSIREKLHHVDSIQLTDQQIDDLTKILSRLQTKIETLYEQVECKH